MTDLSDATVATVVLCLLATLLVAVYVIGFSIGRWRQDKAAAQDEPTPAGQTPAGTPVEAPVEPLRVSSVPLPGTTLLVNTPPTQPAPYLAPAHAAVLPGPNDTGKHHRSFDHTGVQGTRYVPPVRRKETTK